MPDEKYLDEIWMRVLSVLQPFPTQALLRQHCHLLSFVGSEARVGISSPPLLELAQTRLPNIEAAFEKVCQSKVKVSLEVKKRQPTQVSPAGMTKPLPENQKQATPFENTLTYQLGQLAIKKTIDKLGSSTRALVKASVVEFSHNGVVWHIRIVAPNPQVWKRLEKRNQSLTSRFEESLSTFVLSFCVKDNVLPFFGEIRGKVTGKFSNRDVFFTKLNDCKNPWIHIVPDHLLMPTKSLR